MFFICSTDAACAIIPNELIQDNRLSFETRGLLLSMASYGLEKWHVDDFKLVGFHRRRRILTEAEFYGYIQYHSDRLANGRFDCYYTLHIIPVDIRNRAFFQMVKVPDVSLPSNFKDKPCAYCGGVATTRDHVVPVSRGGSNASLNLVPACLSCNSRKGNRTIQEAGMMLQGVGQ